MSGLAISIEGLSKQYRLGLITSHTLREDVGRWYARIRGAADPVRKVDDANRQDRWGESVWALRDVNLEVSQGEVVGIIGRNGAGKSTLLKVLSRISAPTSGRARVRGRIGSLLEVGTGFHPELTGRENVFLNGAILGMKRSEISRKFDEIVAFSEIERFIDTPVKRYSSGMYVRLAFAVAAHLDMDILIVDEVLAVGDIRFQRKCMGKMNSLSGSAGRTVLFVSHNMSAVSSLCSRAVYLADGEVKYDGPVETALQKYLAPLAGSLTGSVDLRNRTVRNGPSRFARLLRIEALADGIRPQEEFQLGLPMTVRFWFELSEPVANAEIGFSILSTSGATLQTFIGHWEDLPTDYAAGAHCVECVLPSVNLFPGTYTVMPWIKRQGERVDDQVPNALEFSVIGNNVGAGAQHLELYPSCGVFQPSSWSLRQVDATSEPSLVAGRN